MRNIYFVEFGNYNFEDVVDKIVFPVETIGELNSIDIAEEKLEHLKTILHKNCVVSITDGIVTGKFSEMYNLESGTIHKYDATYILITVVERDIFKKNYPTFEEARQKMIHELLEDLDDEQKKEYYVNRDSNGNYEGFFFGVENISAWSSVKNRENGDWRIFVC